MPRAICDRCGFEFDLADLKSEWTGLMVCGPDFDPKPAQLTSPNLRAEGRPLRNARPEPPPVFIDPDNPVTADDL